MDDKYLSIYNFNDEIMDEYIYYERLKNLERRLQLNLQEFVEVINGFEVIKLSIVKNQLLLHDDDYRNFVVDEILYDIDKFGYYANDYIEDALAEISTIFDSNVLEHIDEELHDAIGIIREVTYNKYKTKTRKRKNKH